MIDSISQPRKTISLSHKVETRQKLQSEVELALIVIANSFNIARSKYTHAMCILRSISHLCKKNSLLHQVKMRYTQTDTMRQTDGPLVPMVGLVPIQKDVIPMVLLVNMHLIKGT